MALGSFPLDDETHLPPSDCRTAAGGIRRLVGFGKPSAPSPIQRATSATVVRRSPSSDFGENKLSPRSFGISPLTTGHPLVLQHKWVRASSSV